MKLLGTLVVLLASILVVGCSSRVVTYEEPSSGATAAFRLINPYDVAYFNTFTDADNCSDRDVMVDYQYGDTNFRKIPAGKEFAFTLKSGQSWTTDCKIAGSFVPQAGELYELKVDHYGEQCSATMVKIDQSNFLNESEVAIKSMQYTTPEKAAGSWCRLTS